MPLTVPYRGPERRIRDRSQGFQLRRRDNQAVDVERRRIVDNGFDIASALEMHLDQCTTRRAMIGLLESWLTEANNAEAPARDEGYIGAVTQAIEVMKSAPDVPSGIAVLQRRSES